MNDIIAESIVDKIIADIKERSGIGDEWESLTDAMRTQIRKEWTQMVELELQNS